MDRQTPPPPLPPDGGMNTMEKGETLNPGNREQDEDRIKEANDLRTHFV